MIDACTHHEHRSPAQGRLCLAVRLARQHTRSYSSDRRVCELLSLVVRAHEIDGRGPESEQTTVAERIEARVRELATTTTAIIGGRR